MSLLRIYSLLPGWQQVALTLLQDSSWKVREANGREPPPHFQQLRRRRSMVPVQNPSSDNLCPQEHSAASPPNLEGK